MRIAGGFFDKADDWAIALVGMNERNVLFLVEDSKNASGRVDLW